MATDTLTPRLQITSILNDLTHEHDGTWASIEGSVEKIVVALGFTRRHLNALRFTAHELDLDGTRGPIGLADDLYDLADRIEAVLPPE